MRLPILVALAGAASFAAEPAARVLIVTGESDLQYHDWRATTGLLERALTQTGRFDIRRLEDPRGLTPALLAGYDAVLLSYNGPRWGATAEAALEAFVRSGKGLVSYHGVTYGPLMGTILRPDGGWDAGPPWTAFPEMLGVRWKATDIGHAPRHAFPVKLSASGHPIVRGMDGEFTVNDELYHKMSHAPGIEVLASAFDDPAPKGTGKSEPVAWTNAYGQGRVFHCTLGHDTSALYQPSVLALFARATEWAATGKVTLPGTLDLEPPRKNAVRALVVTGGHDYEPSFYGVFEGRPDIRWTHVATQREAFTPGMKDKWDVVVLYDMHNTIGENERNHLREYVEAGKGILSLHHAIVDYTSWPWWYEEVTGGKYFEKAEGSHPASQFKDDVPMAIRPAKGAENHPIVRGLGEIVTVDECYRGMWHSPKIKVLMETENQWNDRPVVYLGPHPRARVVYIQLGHGAYTHNHPGFRTLVHNAMLWAAGRTN